MLHSAHSEERCFYQRYFNYFILPPVSASLTPSLQSNLATTFVTRFLTLLPQGGRTCALRAHPHLSETPPGPCSRDRCPDPPRSPSSPPRPSQIAQRGVLSFKLSPRRANARSCGGSSRPGRAPAPRSPVCRWPVSVSCFLLSTAEADAPSLVLRA